LPSLEPATPSIGSSLRGIRILVVDDEPDSRDFLTFALEEAGAKVTVASSGIEGLKAIRTDTNQQFIFDLIVSDIGMPQMDGYTFLQQIRTLEAAKQVPAIALTAYAGEGDRNQALQAGFQEHSSKPIEPDELIKTISEVLKKSDI
jgi:CheY-like chemotaxis protein